MTRNSGTSLNAERALDILIYLSEQDHSGASLAQIAAYVGSNKASAHRSLRALTTKGFAESAPGHGHYRIGPAVALMAKAQSRVQPHVEHLRPAMQDFARLTGYVTYLMVGAGLDALCVEIAARPDHRPSTMGIGARVPMGVAAGSLALLALLPEAEAEAIMRANATRYESYPSLYPVTIETIREHVCETRQAGFSVNRGLYFFGEGGLGLPLRAAGNGGVNMAISFNLPVEYMNENGINELIGQLKTCLTAHGIRIDALGSGGCTDIKR